MSPLTPDVQDQTGTTSVTRAVTAAADAAGPLAQLQPAERAVLLEAVAAGVEAHTAELVAIADDETALGPKRLNGEVARTTGQLRLFAEVLRDGAYLEATIDHADPSAAPPRPDLRRLLVPLGPVAVFTASNFPFAFSVAGGDTASALAAGCPVVVKAHPGHPQLSDRTATVVQQALADAGAPAGALSHVEGLEAGRELVTAPGIRAVGFTGSLAGGRALFDLAVGRPDPIPFYGELGSINPVVVTPAAAGARADQLASGLQQSFTMGVGQFCTKPGVVFVPAAADLTAQLRGAAIAATPSPMLMPRMLDAFREGTSRLAGSPDVEVILGDVAAMGAAEGAVPMVFATSTAALLADHDRLLEECFGPAVLLVRYASLPDLLAALEVLPGALTASVHAQPEELEVLRPLMGRLQAIAGRVIQDGWPTGVAVTWSMQHGGPWPATTNPLHTSVGATAIRRFLRPLTFQDVHPELLPAALRDDNPLGVPRRVDGELHLAQGR